MRSTTWLAGPSRNQSALVRNTVKLAHSHRFLKLRFQQKLEIQKKLKVVLQHPSWQILAQKHVTGADIEAVFSVQVKTSAHLKLPTKFLSRDISLPTRKNVREVSTPST